MNINGIKAEHKVFAENYVIHWEATKAYKVAYPNCKPESAKASASRLLTDVNVQAYIIEIQKNLEKLTGVTAVRNILELKKIAYTNLADFKNNWMTEKEFSELSDDVKAALSEIQHTTRSYGEGGEEKIVKFKLHDKQRALEALNKMLGFNASERKDIVIQDERKEVSVLFPTIDEITEEEE